MVSKGAQSKDGDRPRRFSRLRRVVRIAGKILLGLLLLIALAAVGARLYLNEARLTALVLPQLEKLLAGRITADGIRWDLPLSISIRGLVVRDPEGVVVLDAKSLEASVKLSRLLAGTLLIEPVRLSTASIRLIPPPEGAAPTRGPFTLIDAFMPKDPSPPKEEKPNEGGGLTIRVGDANLSNVSLFADLAPWKITAEGLTLSSGELELASPMVSLGAGLRVAEVMVRNDAPAPGQPSEIGPTQIILENVHYELDQRTASSDIDLRQLSIALPGASLAASARLNGVPANIAGEVEVTAKARLDAPLVAGFIPEGARPLKLRGEAELGLRFEGSIDDGDLTVSLAGPTLGAFDLLPVAIGLHAKTDADRLTVAPLRIGLPDGAFLEAQATLDGIPKLLSGQVPFEKLRLRHDARVVAHRLPVRALGGGFTDPAILPATLSATITASGPNLTPLESQVELRADVEDIPEALTQGFVRRISLALDAELAGDHARVSSLRAEGDGLVVDVAGRVPFDPAGELDAHLRVEHQQPGPALAQLGAPVSVKSVLLEAVARGPMLNPVASGSFAVEGIHSPGVEERARMHGDLRWNAGTLVVDRAQIDATVGRAIFDARLGLLDAEGQALPAPELFADARLSGIPLALFTQDQVAGEVSASAQVLGTLGTPPKYEVRALVDGGALEVQGATVAYSPIRLEGNQSALVLSPMRVWPPGGGALEAEGRLDVNDQRFAATARIIDLPVAVAKAFAPEVPDLEGVVSGRLRAGGDFARPSATATVGIAGLVVAGQVLGAVRLEAATDSSSIGASLSVDGAAGRLTVDALYPLDAGDLDVRVRGTNLAIESLPGIAGGGVDVTGLLSVDLSAKGKLPEPVVSGKIAVRDLELDDEPLADGNIAIALATPEPAHYALGLRAFRVLTASATVTPTKGGALPVEGDARLNVNDLDVATFVPSLAAAGLAARLSALAELEIGRGKVPVRGKVTIPALNASFGRETLSAAQPIVVSYDGKIAKIESLDLEGSSGKFTARGQVGDAVDVQAAGALQLAFIQPFVPAIAQVSGRIRLDASAKGPVDAPQLSGEVSLIEPAKIRPRGGMREIALDQFQLSLSPTRAKIGQLAGRLGGGRFRAAGDVALEGMMPTRWNLDVDAESIPFRSEDVLIEGDVHVRARGQGPVPRVEGDVAIVRGRYTKKFRLKDFVFVAREPEADSPDAPPPPWLAELVLDLHAQSVGAVDVKVDAQIFAMDVALTADLFIRGTAASPRIEGRVSTEEGTVKFPATELEVTTANIDFVPTPSSGIRPLVDITAEGEAALPPTSGDSRPTTYEITMHVKGPPEEMQLELSSTPSLPQDQVLSLVILGQVDPAALLGGNNTGPKQDRVTSSLVFAGSQLAAPVTHLVEKALDKALNLDLELGAEVSSESVRITAARELTSRLRIEGGYERSLTDDGVATSGSALLFLSSSIFFEGSARTVSGFNTASAQGLNAGTSGTLELKLRMLGN